jgi:hypothetical protein
MNQKLRCAVLSIGVAWYLSLATGVAATVDSSGVTACALSGWSNDPDPSGLNIRAAPSTDAEIIGRVPPAEAQAGDRYAAEFRITGSRNGWFLVSRVKFADYGSGKGDRILFGGPGWVFADKVGFSSIARRCVALPLTTRSLLRRSGRQMGAVVRIARRSIMCSVAPEHLPRRPCTWKASARSAAGSPAFAAIR